MAAGSGVLLDRFLILRSDRQIRLISSSSFCSETVQRFFVIPFNLGQPFETRPAQNLWSATREIVKHALGDVTIYRSTEYRDIGIGIAVRCLWREMAGRCLGQLRPTGKVVVRVIATALALLLGGLPTTNTEIIFHRRDHRDQGNYLSNQPIYNVRSYADALVRISIERNIPRNNLLLLARSTCNQTSYVLCFCYAYFSLVFCWPSF